jgi:hypothetical protein
MGASGWIVVSSVALPPVMVESFLVDANYSTTPRW